VKEKSGGKSYNPIEPIRTAHRKGQNAYLNGTPVVETHDGSPNNCYALYDLEHQLETVPETVVDEIEVKDLSHPFALSASTNKFKKFDNLRDFKGTTTSKAIGSMKDRPCFAFRDTGTCSYGKDCIFSHNAAHLTYDDDHVHAIETSNFACFLVKKLDRLKREYTKYKTSSERSKEKLQSKLKKSTSPFQSRPFQSPSGKQLKKMTTYQSAVGQNANLAQFAPVVYQQPVYQYDPSSIHGATQSDDSTIDVDTRDPDSSSESDSMIDME
jgi:hypothetical protein